MRTPSGSRCRRSSRVARWLPLRIASRRVVTGDFSLTKSRLTLMFYCKNRFGELRDDSDIVLRDL